MARNKPKNLYPIKDLKAANAALAEIAGLKRTIGGIESRLNDKIDQLKAQAAADSSPSLSKLDALENGLLAFAVFNKADLFVEKRSKELDFGAIGFRRSTEVKPKSKITWAMVLEKIKALGFKEAILVEEKPNKEELHKWPDERLALVDVHKVEKDTFWYEIDAQKVANAV